MTRHPDPVMRDALRARLASEVEASRKRHTSAHPGTPRQRGLWTTGVVAVAVIVGTVLVLRLPIGAHIDGGREGSAPIAGSTSAIQLPVPVETLPAGKLLGRFSSDDGPNQDHIIHPGTLAIATQFICTGRGAYSVLTAGGTGESGDGSCDGTGGVGSGNGTSSGTASVKIRTDPDMRWTYTLVGIARPAQTKPRPIPTPTDTAGSPVVYCTSSELTARFVATTTLQHEADGELIFTNYTGQTCALAGYPEVRFLDHGTPLGHNTMNQIDPRRSTDHGLRAVILAPGKSAYSQVNWYLPGVNAQFEGACVERKVTDLQIDLHYDLASPGQTGTLVVPIGTATACLNGAHGALGKYGQIASTVFLDYSVAGAR